MQAEVAAIAVGLFLDRGFEETTVDDICAAAEISRSTFFRYFPSKEDALFGRSADAGRTLLAALAARPIDEKPWTALRHAFAPRLAEIAQAGEYARRLTRLIVTTPALAARHRDKNAIWLELLRPEVARRIGADPDDGSDPRTDAIISAALGCLDAALTAWTSNDQTRELPELLDRAMNAVT
jgi:AcrR family transcriptional regulator